LSTSLASELKRATSELHARVEQTGIIAKLIQGELTQSEYCLLLRNLAPLYRAMEMGLATHCEHPAIAPVYDPNLFRTPYLADDLVCLHGPDWREQITLSAAAREYANHVRELAAAKPALLVAHAYVRYMGDMSGGQIIKRRIARALNLPLNQGLSVHDFGSRAQLCARLHAFRTGLNQIPLTTEQQSEIIIEACVAFDHHVVIAQALSPDL
jgi:heme oxygenase